MHSKICRTRTATLLRTELENISIAPSEDLKREIRERMKRHSVSVTDASKNLFREWCNGNTDNAIFRWHYLSDDDFESYESELRTLDQELEELQRNERCFCKYLGSEEKGENVISSVGSLDTLVLKAGRAGKLLLYPCDSTEANGFREHNFEGLSHWMVRAVGYLLGIYCPPDTGRCRRGTEPKLSTISFSLDREMLELLANSIPRNRIIDALAGRSNTVRERWLKRTVGTILKTGPYLPTTYPKSITPLPYAHPLGRSHYYKLVERLIKLQRQLYTIEAVLTQKGPSSHKRLRIIECEFLDIAGKMVETLSLRIRQLYSVVGLANMATDSAFRELRSVLNKVDNGEIALIQSLVGCLKFLQCERDSNLTRKGDER